MLAKIKIIKIKKKLNLASFIIVPVPKDASKVKSKVSLKVDGVHVGHTKQRAVLEGEGSEGVTGGVPQTAAADLHALPRELPDVDQDDSLVSGDQEVLHAGSYHLARVVQNMNRI